MMDFVIKKLPILLLALLGANVGFSQCETFASALEGPTAKTTSALYKAALQEKDFEKALSMWEKAFKIAPKADGKSAAHFKDGIKIYKYFLEHPTQDISKQAAAVKIEKLYDQWLECFGETGYLYENKAYDMYYFLGADRKETYQVFKQSIQLGKEETKYFIFEPYSLVSLDAYHMGLISSAQLLGDYQQIVQGLRYLETTAGEKELSKVKAAKERIIYNFEVKQKGDLGCDFFWYQKEKEYQEYKRDVSQLKRINQEIASQKCKEFPFWAKALQEEYAPKKAPVIKKEKSILAKATEADKAGDNRLALQYYQEALGEVDVKKQREIRLRMGYIQDQVYSDFTKARAIFEGLLEQYPKDGKVNVSLGDLYLKHLDDLGLDEWGKQMTMVLIMHYYHAALTDSEYETKAQHRIQKYLPYLPKKEELFMRNISEYFIEGKVQRKVSSGMLKRWK